MLAHEYDLVVIGSGPAGQKGAICAAKPRKRVAIIDRRLTMGGVCVHTGTIPSKVLREAVLYLSGLRQRSFCGRGYVVTRPDPDVGSGPALHGGDDAGSRRDQGAAPAESRQRT